METGLVVVIIAIVVGCFMVGGALVGLGHAMWREVARLRAARQLRKWRSNS